MADTKTIKNKLKTVGNIKKITKAMEMVARSKMKRAIDRALSVRPFAFFGLEFLVNFSYHGSAQNIYFKKSEGTRTLIVEIAANKGLAGGYNGNMFRELRRYIAREHIENADYIAVGKYAVSHVRMLQGTLLHSYTGFSGNTSFAESEALVESIKAEYASGRYGTVLIAFTNFLTTLSQKPVVYQLLPLSPEIFTNQLSESGDEGNRIEMDMASLKRDWTGYVVEQSEEAILDVVIPKLVSVQVYQALLEAEASEQAARMVAMKNATENADNLADALTLSYNHLRQEGITREISEIAAGALQH